MPKAKRKTAKASEKAAKKRKAEVTQEESEQNAAPAPEPSPVTAEADLLAVRQQEELIQQGKKHHNNIVTLLDLVEAKMGSPESTAIVLGAAQSLRRVFTKLADSGDLRVQASKAGKSSNDKELDAAEQYKAWLRGLYKRYTRLSLSLLLSEDVRLQASSLHSLMDFVKVEWTQTSEGNGSFSGTIFAQTMLVVLTHPALAEVVRDDIVAKFLKPHTDLRYYAIKNIKSSVDAAPDTRQTQLEQATLSEGEWKCPTVDADVFARNTIEILLRLKLPQDKKHSFFALGAETKAEKKKYELSKQREILSDAWLSALRITLPPDVYKLVLVHLHKHVLPLLTDPLLLSDFLTDAFNLGGVVSLLSLDGLFVLITKHNLDYPNFFAKLYALCKPSFMHAKYRSRFFTLLALSLTSGHIPVYLVAAFAKRLARLCLEAPPGACVFLATAVFNLLRRHPAARFLVHNPPAQKAGLSKVTMSLLAQTGGATPATDAASPVLALNTPAADAGAAPTDAAAAPGADLFDPLQDDPALSRAERSSLWEMKCLTNHYCPAVSRMAKELFADNAMKAKDFDVKEAVNHSYTSLFTSELDWRKNQKTPLAYEKPGALLADDPEGIFGF